MNDIVKRLPHVTEKSSAKISMLEPVSHFGCFYSGFLTYSLMTSAMLIVPDAIEGSFAVAPIDSSDSIIRNLMFATILGVTTMVSTPLEVINKQRIISIDQKDKLKCLQDQIKLG